MVKHGYAGQNHYRTWNKTIGETIKENPKGFTVDIETMKLAKPKGFIVSFTDNKILNGITDDTKDSLFSAILKTANSLRMLKYPYKIYLGYWKDEKTQKEYIDLSVCIDSEIDAFSFAMLHKQKAIYDSIKDEIIILELPKR